VNLPRGGCAGTEALGTEPACRVAPERSPASIGFIEIEAGKGADALKRRPQLARLSRWSPG
jgi:hypothetical protein